MSQRTTSFAETAEPTMVDRLGRWLSTVRMRRLLGDVADKRAADIGCGHDGALARSLFQGAAATTLVDISLDPSLAVQGYRCLEGYLPQVMTQVDDGTIDALICNNVLEHLEKPEETVAELYRVLAPGGVCVLNVPSWRGKKMLEFAAFRLGVAPREEMDDHRWYYDPRDLWPMLVRVGFRPSDLLVRKHKGGLNTIARCRKPAD